MLRYLRLYRYFLEQQFKIAVEYRSNFVLGAVGALFVNGASLLTIWVVMSQIPSLNGWTLQEVLLIYGLVVLSRSLSQMFTENLWQVGGYVQEGSLDRFLVRPINPLFQLLAERLDPAGVGTFLIGLVLVFSAGQALDIYSPFKVVYLTAAVLSGGAIFFALNLMTSASAFWIIDSTPVISAVFENFRFAHYPLSIYPRAINWMLTWVIPYGFASFYPASFLLGRDIGPMAWLSPVVAAVLVVLGYRLWGVGLRRYASTGS